MRVLAIETSGLYGSIACLENESILADVSLPTDQRSAQSLAPAIERLLRDVGWQPGDIELIGVAQGPGSFTGLRVGITTAKTLAYACQADVLGVSTMDVVAHQAPDSGTLDVVLDAQRSQLFAARYLKTDADVAVQIPTHISDIERWLASLPPGGQVTGSGLKKLRDDIPATTTIIDDDAWQPLAITVGQLASQAYKAGHRETTLWELTPRYYRRSAAEEKLST